MSDTVVEVASDVELNERRDSLARRINLIDEMTSSADTSAGGTIKRIRLGANEAFVIPFTAEGEQVDVHFLEAKDYRDYVQCTGEDCLLCKIGKSVSTFWLLPVYVPTERRIDVLPISSSCQPGGLRAQLAPLLKHEDRQVLAIRKDSNVKYAVASYPLHEGQDNGATAIARFRELWDAGQIELAKVYNQLDDSILAQMPEVEAIMKVKGISLS